MRIQVSDFASFREQARGLVSSGVRPEVLSWEDPREAQTSLFAGDEAAVRAREARAQASPTESEAPVFRVPARYLELAERAALYRSSDSFALLYRVLFRLAHGEPRLIDDELDHDVRELVRRADSVRHDEHRMHAFVRFRRVMNVSDEEAGEPLYVAWYRPEHHIVHLAAPFFQRRFASMHWSILTPDESVSWDGEQLRYGPGAPRAAAPSEDELEHLFRTYYRATFNPARANLRLFRHHVPAGFQRDMPELTVLSELAKMPKRAKADEEEGAAAPLVPRSRALSTLREAASHCLACPLGPAATQTVFGEGPKSAHLCMVGEQPGNDEDLSGTPFVGPAGKLLDRAMQEVGLPRRDVYLTNAVKHFNYRPLGKKRLHAKPEWKHVEACRPWLRAELAAVQPKVVLCLGATAAQAFFGRRFTLLKNRGQVFETPWAAQVLVTYHPSAVLRMPDHAARDEAYRALCEDLRRAMELAK